MKKPSLHRDRRGRVRRSAHERHELIERYQTSGLGKAAFCRRHGLHLATFCGWLKRAPAFAEVMLPPEWKPDAQVDADRACVRIEMPGGLRIMVHDPGALKLVAPFIREVLAC